MYNFAVITEVEQNVVKEKEHLKVLKQTIKESKAKIEK